MNFKKPAALPHSPEDWVEIFREAPCGFILTNSAGLILKVNDTLKEWLGYEGKELETKKRFQDLLAIGDRIFYETKHSNLLKLQDQVNEINYNLVTKDGNKKPVLLNSAVTRKGGVGSEIYQFIILPFSERKKYENELIFAKKKSEEVSEAKSNFFSTITHEIRTPIHAILNAGTILLNENPTREQRELLEIISFSSHNLLELVNSILDLTKMEHGEITIVKESFDLKQLFQNLVKIYKPLAQGKNIDFKLLIPKTIPKYFLGDNGKIRQIFTNLIGNAIKFTQEGFIQLEMKLINKNDTNYTIRFLLEDTGIGMTSEELQKIFDPFTQANNSIHQKFGGSGLGLTISQRLLKLLNSSLIVSSKVGRGSTFSFDLTMQIASEPPEHDHSLQVHIHSLDLSDFRVLVVDDIYSNILILKRYFKIWKAIFEYASNGKDAIEKVRSKEYDLVFMDISMPQMDGYETVKRIRALEGDKFKLMPIIALSAFDSNEIKDKVQQSGMDGLLQKPFQVEQLHETILEYGKVKAKAAQAFQIKKETEAIQLNFQSARLCDFFENDHLAIIEYLEVAIDEIEQVIEDFDIAQEHFSLSKFKLAAHKNAALYRLLHLDDLKAKMQEAEKFLLDGERTRFKIRSNEIKLALRQIVIWMKKKIIEGEDICNDSNNNDQIST